MILTDEHLKYIVNEEGFYDCSLLQQRFANKILKSEVSPLGDVFCFVAPTIIGSLVIEQALVIAAELPNIDLFGGVCFQRLYSTQIGSLISTMNGKDCFVDESCIFVDGEQTSLSLVNKVKDSVMFHVVFALTDKQQVLQKLLIPDQYVEEFKLNAVESFKYLTKSIFIETRRDNF